MTRMLEIFEMCWFSYFPVFIAFMSVLVISFWMNYKWRRKHDPASLEEDKSLTEEIKSNFNPDVLSTGFNEHPNHVAGCEIDVSKKFEGDGGEEMEIKIQQAQLKQIFQLVGKEKEKYGISSIDDLREQMKRYKTS